jgi:hypothetical protein
MRHYIFPAIALSALTALTLPAAANAQAHPPGHDRMDERGWFGRGAMPAARIIELREELALTAEQVERINGIQEQLREQNGPLLEQLAAARQEMQGRRQLTDEERARMQQRREAMRDSMRSRASMSAEQREQMRAQMQERRANGMRARSDSAGRPGPGMPDELRPVMEQLRANTAGAMQQIQETLTTEQQQKLRELRPAPGRPAGHGEHAPGARGRTRGAPRGAR